MTGDPKVLAPLQQAYLKLTSHPKDIGDMALLQLQWEDHYGVIAYRPFADVDAEIRAWTPPPAEPSLEQRMAELEAKHGSLKAKLDKWVPASVTITENHEERISALEQHPEPTAPDDPVCVNCNPCGNCGHRRGIHGTTDLLCREPDYANSTSCKCPGYVPAPQPAPDLDPVRVEAAAKAAWEDGGRMTSWDEASADIHELWIRDAGLMITTYLKGGGA